MRIRTCQYVDFSDLTEILTESEFEELSDYVPTAYAIFGDTAMTFVPMSKMCDYIRACFPEELGNDLVKRLTALVPYNAYFELEN